jgi:YD repeat-containing protein
MKNKSLILTSLLIFLLVLAFPAYAAVYTYDGLNRLKSVTYENGLQITYNYDAAGNVLSVSSTGIGNNNPEVGGITITPDLVPVNTSVSAYVYYTDPDAGDTHTAVWDWGDGTNTPGTVDEAGQKITGTHQYTTPGVYTVKAAVSDNGPATGEAVYQYVVVYDPEGGFVTGGGWINSPAGAYINEPALTGKAIFGFVSKYQKGANIPTGQTQFQFKTADLNFYSTSYDWLVVSGSKAQFKGTGTINGAGEYGFMLSAIDGDLKGEPDKFRIKIWDKATDIVVYDNQSGEEENADPSTLIGGGNIIIHKQ